VLWLLESTRDVVSMEEACTNPNEHEELFLNAEAKEDDKELWR